MNSSIIFIGGEMKEWDWNGSFSPWVYSGAYSVRLEPKTLQQLAMQKIYHHKVVFPWKLLPHSLKTLFQFPVVVADE